MTIRPIKIHVTSVPSSLDAIISPFHQFLLYPFPFLHDIHGCAPFRSLLASSSSTSADHFSQSPSRCIAVLISCIPPDPKSSHPRLLLSISPSFSLLPPVVPPASLRQHPSHPGPATFLSLSDDTLRHIVQYLTEDDFLPLPSFRLHWENVQAVQPTCSRYTRTIRAVNRHLREVIPIKGWHVVIKTTE